ncbi:MAG: hypothetical protein WC797_01755 [Candidatus Paceibacterota bacterium]|jgi:thymidylate kinase
MRRKQPSKIIPVTQADFNDFERRATAIRQFLKPNLRHNLDEIPRSFFVEFTGSPSSGKTTTITELDKFFRRQEFRVLRPQEGAEVIRHIERSTPLYNLRTGMYALSLLIDLASGHQYDLVIFDRCIFDAYCWMMYWKEKGLLSDEELACMQSFFTSRFWMNKIDAAYFMVCDPKIAMERELKIALSQKLGDTTNPETIKKLVGRYTRAYQTLSPTCPQLTLLDTTGLSEIDMIQQVANNILGALEKKIRSGK